MKITVLFTKLASPFSKLWRGQQPLAKAFWLFFGLGGTLTPLAALAVAEPFRWLRRPELASPFVFAVLIGYPIFATIGLWRSADEYLAHSATNYVTRAFYVAAAKVGSCFVLLGLMTRPTLANLIHVLSRN